MNKNDYTKFSAAEIGMEYTRPLLVVGIEEVKKDGKKPFMRFAFSDGFSQENIVMFDTDMDGISKLGIRKYSVADVTLKVSTYNNSKSFLVTAIRPCSDPTASADDFAKTAPLDRYKMYDEILDLVRSCADDLGGTVTPVSELTEKILNDNKDNFIRSTAAVGMHHNFLGGLVYHTYRMVKSADALSGVYTDLDRELLICGAALHDIGKIWEYNTHKMGDADYSSTGVLFGHLHMGAALIKRAAEDGNYSMEKVKLLTHMILSHHGRQEWGAVVPPATPEAFVLHFIDNIDARVNMCEKEYETLAPGEITDKKPFGLEGRIYKPKY
ncbi:MAG: HD domain-containing protein [Ruminococcus sp.]|nr:HD domain-containing protein [Ruminococcus sp.]